MNTRIIIIFELKNLPLFIQAFSIARLVHFLNRVTHLLYTNKIK